MAIKEFKTIHPADASGTDTRETTLADHINSANPHPNLVIPTGTGGVTSGEFNQHVNSTNPHPNWHPENDGNGWSGVLDSNGLIRDTATSIGLTAIICNSANTTSRNNLFYHNQTIMLNDSDFASFMTESSYWLPSPATVPVGARVCYLLYNTQSSSAVVAVHANGSTPETIDVTVPATHVREVVFTCVTGDGGTTREWSVLYDTVNASENEDQDESTELFDMSVLDYDTFGMSDGSNPHLKQVTVIDDSTTETAGHGISAMDSGVRLFFADCPMVVDIKNMGDVEEMGVAMYERGIFYHSDFGVHKRNEAVCTYGDYLLSQAMSVTSSVRFLYKPRLEGFTKSQYCIVYVRYSTDYWGHSENKTIPTMFVKGVTALSNKTGGTLWMATKARDISMTIIGKSGYTSVNGIIFDGIGPNDQAMEYRPASDLILSLTT